tara:strand:- start:16726 stop:17217 length:492 start_codon:yes stop_codon:yes gene_type:complete
MAFGNNDDNLISHLLEETYQSLPHSNIENSHQSLDQHFDKLSLESSALLDPTLENFIARQSEQTLDLEYLAKIGCYRLRNGEHVLDLPGNWDVFQNLARELSYTDLTTSELAPLLATIIGKPSRVLLMGSFGRAQLVVFEQADEFSIKWIEKYFSSVEKKEAA